MTALQRLVWLAKQARDENQASSGTAFKIPPHKSYSVADTVKRLSLAPYGAARPGIKGPGGSGTLNPNTQPEFVAGQARPVFYPNVPPGASKPYYVPPIKPIRKEEMADILRLAN